MLAALVLAASVAHASAGCAAARDATRVVLEQRLDVVAASPVNAPFAERACLAAAASRLLGRYPRKGTLKGAVTPALAKALAPVAPQGPATLALGRADVFQTLANQLRGCTTAPCADARMPAPPGLVPIDQSEQGFLLWQRVEPGRASAVRRLEAFLKRYGAAGVVPTFQLLRAASDWKICGGEPFAVPPQADWPHVIGSLKFIKARVEPAIGPVEAMSAYRAPDLNVCAQGAKESAHLGFWAVDLEPVNPLLTRAALMNALCRTHKQYGQGSAIGLGFYAKTRFHIDDKRYRHWGFDPVAAPACAAAIP